MQIILSVSPSFPLILSPFTHMHSFILSLSVLCVLWCFIWYPTIKPLFELPSIVYGFSSEEKQRAVWKGSSPAGCLHIDAEEYCHPHCWINHSRHCCFMAGATSQKEAWQHHHRGLQTDTALIVEQDGRGPVERSKKHLGMNLKSVTVTHMHSHISLLYSCGSIWFTAQCA